MEDAPPHLTLIGTGHVLDIAGKVRDAIAAIQPHVVFVELDRGRLLALQQRRAGHSPAVQGGWLQRRMHRFQESVAAEYGVKAGDEMLAAVDGGFLVGARIQLIDRPIQQTLQRVTTQITWKERLQLAAMVAGGFLKGLFERRSTKDVVDQELAEYAADPVKTLTELRDKFPSIHRVVIAERDAWMVARIRRGLGPGQRGVAVVGDGHVDGMLALLDDVPTTTFRLPDVQSGRLPRIAPDDTSVARFSFAVGQDPPKSL